MSPSGGFQFDGTACRPPPFEASWISIAPLPSLVARVTRASHQYRPERAFRDVEYGARRPITELEDHG